MSQPQSPKKSSSPILKISNLFLCHCDPELACPELVEWVEGEAISVWDK